ncbi:hypothetical protein LTR53_009358 [Teratosphaeriaceae sp. CCFEE 6253]|nr:hypothetical protein LTR53_009358 [Teratosphaeriaceae sp. CCFEE 6253]
MSDAPTKTTEYQWQHPSASAYDAPLYAAHPLQSAPIPGPHNEPKPPPNDAYRPPLRSHKSFPYSLGPSSRLQEGGRDEAGAPALVEFEERLMSQGPQPVGTSNLPAATFGGSAPTSPAGGRLTPNSPGGDLDDEQLEDEEMAFGTAEQGEDEERPPMTAAELRAHKRKMKRFRLTHNQTRFLMSEFARQPHPDAAHRERLSREIPGLSPRQVQVWFQNRRAKLKRLTTDDRERMLRSRALPADFDMTQALHAPFGAQPPPTVGTPMPSPGAYGPLGEVGGMRPLTLDTMRRGPEFEPYAPHHFASPTGITPALGAFAFTPPQSATDTLSPASITSAASNYSFAQESPRRFPFPIPLGTHAGYGAQQHPHVPRLHLHDRFSRPGGESAGSPLRTSMSYAGLGAHAQSQPPPQERSSSLSEHSSGFQDRPLQHRSHTNPTGSSAGPIGLGFSYMPQYAPSDHHPHHQQQQQPSDAQYRRSSSHLAGPPLTSFVPPYPPPQYSASQMSQYPGYAAHFPSPQPLPTAYHPQQQQQQQQQPHSFSPIPSQPQQQQQQHFLPLSSSAGGPEPGEEGGGGGGERLPTAY